MLSRKEESKPADGEAKGPPAKKVFWIDLVLLYWLAGDFM